jgi:poly-gamma-glutamate synthesis protein (capsule biosynthesis protein)
MTFPNQAAINRAIGQAFTVIVGITLLLQWSNSNSREGSSPIEIESKDKVGYDTIRLAIVGDLMCHSQQFTKARTGNGFDFRPVFEPVKKYLSSADLTFGNLETVTAGEEAKFTGYPMFNTPVEFLDGLKESGFDVLTTANNHSLDRRFQGVVKTLEELDRRNLLHTGTARSATEQQTPLIINRQGFKLGILAYTYSTNGIPIPAGQEYCVNMIDTAQMKKDISATRAAGADLVAVFMHWGDEYQRFPNTRQKELANFLHEQGVMLILGSHPHVLQPSQLISKNNSSSFTIYSMGNFVSGQRKQYTDCGIIIRIQMIKNRKNGSIQFGVIDYIPTYVSTVRGFRIIPVADAIEAIKKGNKLHPAYTPDAGEQTRIQQVWKETTEHINSTEAGIQAFEENE